MQFLQKNVPAPLYKFRECTKNNLYAFTKDEIWLSKVSNFNDLHDGLLFFDKRAILKQAEQIFSSENLSAIFQSLKRPQFILDRFSFNDLNMQAFIGNGLSSLDEQTFIVLMQQFIPNLASFLDSQFQELKNGIRNQTKRACLSGNIESPLMWAHYADNHKGFAIGYDFTGNIIIPCKNCPNRLCNNIKHAVIYPMLYSDDRFDATQYGKWSIEQYIKTCFGITAETVFDDDFLFTKAALHKSNDWKYEDEWRIICSTPVQETEQKDCYPINKSM